MNQFIIETNFLGDEIKIVAQSDSPEEAIESILGALAEFAEEHKCLDYLIGLCISFAENGRI